MNPLSIKSLAVVFILSLAGACTILPESEPVQLLDPGIAVPDAAGESADWSLNVARPESDPIRDSNRVLVRTGQSQLQVHASARWTAAAPEMVRTLLVRHLRDAGSLEQVRTGASGLDRTLVLDLRRFELDDPGAGRLAAEIRLEARLYDSRSAALVARRLFEARESVDDSGPAEIVRGFETTLGAIIPAVAAWAIEQGTLADQSDEE